MPKFEKYALLIVAVLLNGVLIAGAVVGDLSPHIAAEWGTVLTIGLGVAHAGLEAIRVKFPDDVPAGLLGLDTDQAAEDIESFVDPAHLSEAEKAPNPPVADTPAPAPVVAEPAPAPPEAAPAPVAPSDADKLRDQLTALGATPVA